MMDKAALLAHLRAKKFPPKVISAFEKVPRENFVSSEFQSRAYEDEALPLEGGAAISQPRTIALMLSLLDPMEGDRVLEIGSGSGYVLALISELTHAEVHGVELIKSLVEKSKKLLKNYKDIHIHHQDGSKGLPSKAPFDKILISAATDEIPAHLYTQLKDPGVLVVPVKNSIFQITKTQQQITLKEYPGFVFVPLRKS